VRFTDFLKATVLVNASAATALAAVTMVGANRTGDAALAVAALGTWLAAGMVGAWLGRRTETTTAIAGLLAAARFSPALPELSPARTLVNRLWPLALLTVGSGGLAFAYPQVPMIAAAFAIVAALGWRRQEAAVAAIEDRDGVRFYVERTSPVQAIRLVRTPGFHSEFPSADGGGRAKRAPLPGA
jgi:hypothetical protein